jgi:hypothetical protein
MKEKRIQFNVILQNQLPSYIREEFPLVAEFLNQYYISQEFQSAPADLIQNIDQYIKLDVIKNEKESATLSSDVSFLDDVINISSPSGTSGFPDSYGLLQIDDEIITYTGKTLTSFTGCIRGFSGVSSYQNTNKPDTLVFSTTESTDHSQGATVTNLSSLFLKEFFNKIKYQLTPGFENREFYSELDKYLFLKQSKDFYSTRGTDLSFKILFKALYGEEVKIIKPQDYVIKPSDANYEVVNSLVVEKIEGDPYDLVKSTLFQDEYNDILSKAYVPISNVEKIFSNNEKIYYRLDYDAGYNRDIIVDGSLYGNFSIHPKTKNIGDILVGQDTIDVDSTVGFPESGDLFVTYIDGTNEVISYSSKNINQFFGIKTVSKQISDKSDICLNVYAYGSSNKNQNETIKVRITSVLNRVDIVDENHYYDEGDVGIIKTLGVNPKDSHVSNNWFFNYSTLVDIAGLVLIDSSNKTYRLTSKDEHDLKIGDSIKLLSNDGIEKISTVSNIVSSNIFEITGQGDIDSTKIYSLQRLLSKVKSSKYSDLTNQITDVQNIYKIKDRTLVASSSLPSYYNQPINVSDKSVVFSGTFIGDTFTITSSEDHGFYSGDSIYYTPDVGSLFSEGVYYIQRVNPNSVKFAKSRSNIYNSIFVNLENPITVSNSKIELYEFYSKSLASQKLLREISSPINDGQEYETNIGPTGILINGVEILNYKSKDTIYYGSIEDISVVNSGSNYDIINPPELVISDSVGTGATGYCSVKGGLREIKIIDPGFDYIETPKINITGGNGTGAKANAVMKLIDHQSQFNSELSSSFVSITNNTIGFSTYHKFRNTERIIYKTNGQKGIGGITTDSSYYVSSVDLYTIKLHNTFDDARLGINTISLTSYGIGNHLIESYNKKLVLSSINIENSGSDYENKKRTTSEVGVSTSLNAINIKNHGFKSGEIIVYSSGVSPINGLVNNQSYYVTELDNDHFKLSLVGIGTDNLDFYYRTNQYVNFDSQGSGTHYFNYPPVSVEVVGSVGIASTGNDLFKARLQPIFRGEITSVHLKDGGVGYGSSEIINFERTPSITLNSGSECQLSPIINNGRISEVFIVNPGSGYNSPPNLDIITESNGIGAILTPILENGRIVSVKIVEGGIGYDQSNTFISVTPSGVGADFRAKLKSWNINLVAKHFNKITNDDGFILNNPNSKYGLQFTHLYAPRKLREIVYSKELGGKTIYGRPDLIRVRNNEVSSTNHSPIIGWAYDGNPIYGPYAYSTKSGGTITRMKSGYTENLQPNRPPQSIFPVGFFVEDYEYRNVDNDSVLDEYNGRFCVTPDFPNGTYAYFATIQDSTSTAFGGYRLPQFPYFIGNKYKSSPNPFNFKISSNQDDINLNKTDWVRNTKPLKLTKTNLRYPYVNLPNSLNQTVDIKYTTLGSIENVGVVTGGVNYKVNDSIIINESETGGFGFVSKVSKIGGKSVNNISVASTTIYDVTLYPSSAGRNSFVIQSDSPHGFSNNDIVNLSGFNTTSSMLEGSYIVGVSTNTLAITDKSGIGTIGATGIVTYISVSGDLSFSNLKENDIFTVESEKVKILNIDRASSRIRALRSIDGTVGSAHSYSRILYQVPRRLTINAGFTTSFNHKENREYYFNPKESLGIGTVSGVGIGTTISFSNPGVGATQIFIQTKSIYLPNHKLETGDELIYSTNNGSPISVSNSGSSSYTLSDQSIVYAAKISSDLIGISTVKVGLGTTGTFVGIASTTKSLSTLHLTGIGTGTYHSFATNYSRLTSQISKNIVTVSAAQTHGLSNNDYVYIDVNPGISTTLSIKYSDYTRKVLINSKEFLSSAVDTTLNTITINNHNLTTGQKVVHTSTSPSGGLQNNKIYYVVVFDNNTIKLSDSYYNSISLTPEIVNITSSSSGSISQVNPPINVYRNSTVVFDLSDSSLSYSTGSSVKSAFELNFYLDENFTQIFDKANNDKDFSVNRFGTVGISSDAKVVLEVNSNTPNKLYYRLDPVYSNGLPINKKEVNVDDTVISNNQIIVGFSKYNGKHQVVSTSSTSFAYSVPLTPEFNLYDSSSSKISYETDSLSAFGPITDIKIFSKGQNYRKLPVVSDITSEFGSGAIIELSSNSIGKIQKTKINSSGFDFSSDFTLKPNLSFPQILKIESLKSFDTIGITSIGRGYTTAPKLLVFDGKTKNIVPEVDLRYSLSDTEVSILTNSYGLNDIEPIIVPTQNSNGVGIASMKFNPSTNDVSVTLSVGFSTANSFPFSINDKIFIENVSVGIASTAKGFNSENYNYQFFTITSVDPNIGGIGTVTYNLTNFLLNGETPGIFDPTNSSGRVIPEKYLPKFKSTLKSNDFLLNEKVKYLDSEGEIGFVSSWDKDTGYLKVSSLDIIEPNKTIQGLSSKTRGIISSSANIDAFIGLDFYLKSENGWMNQTGFMNDNLQRIQDSFYYQNFSYSLKSKVPYDTWEDAVGSLNHTAGFKKFSDYQFEPFLNEVENNTLSVGISTNTLEVKVDIIGVGDLNCSYDFDLGKENALRNNSNIISDEITLSNTLLTDYFESIGNRVLSIDDISGLFNSNPRSTRFSSVYRFLLDDARAQKYITFIRDKRYSEQKQLMLLTLVHDGEIGYLNQYGRVETAYDLGSFDFLVDGAEGVINFYPTKYEVNDYDVQMLSYNLKNNFVGVGSTNIGDIVNLNTNTTFVSSGSTTIVSFASTYTSSKVLVEISDDNNEYVFDELSIVHDGTNVEFINYGQLNTFTQDSFSSSGFGTYHAYLSGSKVNIDFIPNVGVAATINAAQISIANTSTTGIGSFDMLYARINASTTSIASSTSPIPNTIASYSSTEEFGGGYFIVQVSDITNNMHQLFEVVLANDETETYLTRFASIETHFELGEADSQKIGDNVELTFTPLANIDVQVKVYFNSLTHLAYEGLPTEYYNKTLTTGYGYYFGTERDIKRSFDLKHRNYPIFRRNFNGGSSSVVSIAASTITIPNHFFVTGEKINYSYKNLLTVQSPIGIKTTDFGVGIGTTDKLPSTAYIVKLNDNTIQLAKSAEDALKTIPEILSFTSVGTGSSHSITSVNQNSKIIVAIDNIIQSPIVSTAITATLNQNLLISEDVLYLNNTKNFFSGDLIRLDNEIMLIDSVGIGSTNAVRVIRPWMGTEVISHTSGEKVTKVIGDYNIVDNSINFISAPYGNIPLSSTTNSPSEIDWVGISTSSSFQGRSFMRSGVKDSSNESYYKNYVFDDISSGFNGIGKTFTLSSNLTNISDISDENAVILINNIFQSPGLTNEYTLSGSVGITSISFVGTATSLASDINTSNLPSGGIIVSVGSSEGFGYQPLISAGGTSVVSVAGTISSIGVGNSGSGYRSSTKYEILSDVSYPIGIGETRIYLSNKNSIYQLTGLLNTGSNCKIGVGTFINNSTITSIGSSFVTIGFGNTSSYQIPANTSIGVEILNPQIGIVNVGLASSSIGISTITHIGFTTIISGNISTNVRITNVAAGYTSTNPPLVIFDDPLSYNNIPLIYSSSSSGIGTNAVIDIVVGQGSSVIDFEIKNTGYGYNFGEILTVPLGGITGIPTSRNSTFREFQISIQESFTDKFTGWSIGQLQPLDKIENLFDDNKVIFPLSYLGNLISIFSSKGSQINIQDTLLVFLNDILQVPGEGYIFEGGSSIEFTEAPKSGDTCRILFYKGSGDVDVIFRNILETVKVGDELTLTYDASLGQKPKLLENPRTVTNIKSISATSTFPYFGPGNTSDSTLKRPVVWCRQTEDKIIDEIQIGKDRMLYEPLIYPSSYIIQSVGIGSTIVFVDSVRPFFNPINENNVTLNFQKNITFVSQDTKISASATCVVSTAGTISSIVIEEGGFGYVSAPSVSIQNPVGVGSTTSTAIASITSGIVTSISVVGVITGYSQSTPPSILVESPNFKGSIEEVAVGSYSGDFGIISGVSTVSVGVASTGIQFDFVIPKNSYLRDASIMGITGVSTVSGIQTGYYFVIHGSNVGNGVTSLNSNGSIVGVGTSFLDGVYQAVSVSIGQTSVIGLGVTYVAKVIVSVSGYNQLSGIGYSGYFGNFSWGRIELRPRTKLNQYNAYTIKGYSGISTGTMVKRTTPLKYLNYVS